MVIDLTLSESDNDEEDDVQDLTHSPSLLASHSHHFKIEDECLDGEASAEVTACLDETSTDSDETCSFDEATTDNEREL